MTTAKLDLTVMETTEGPELPFYLDELIIIGQWETTSLVSLGHLVSTTWR